jgi:type VI secretion system protein ImpC
MAKDWRSEIRLVGDVEAAARPGDEAGARAEAPVLISVLADLGAAAADGDTLGRRRFIDIDRDNFDAVLARHDVRWGGSLRGMGGGADVDVPVELTFQALDDFHPDRIVERIAPLRQVLELRRALDDPSRFEAAARAIGEWLAPGVSGAGEGDVSARPAPVEVSPAELLDQILGGGGAAGSGAAVRLAKTELQQFLQEIVKPHLVGIDTRRQAALTGAVDRVLSEQMRAVLHDPGFQRVEAVWRSLRRLVAQIDTGTGLKVRVLHLTKEELARELRSGVPADERVLARLIVDAAAVAGGQGPVLIVGAYEFADTSDDLALLAHLGAVAGQVDATFVAAASPALLRCSAFTALPSAGDLEGRVRDPEYAEWQALRSSAVASRLALALPRLLCRLPYGADVEPIESFAFEEQATAGRHDTLLWGNPAFAVAEVVGRAIGTGALADVAVSVQHLEGLPLYVYDQDGTAVTKPCAEVLMTERVVEALAKLGLVPLVSHANRDTVALPCLQSAAYPSRPLHFHAQGR